MPDVINVCKDCDISCETGYCKIGASSVNCTKCKVSLFLNTTNSCISAIDCEQSMKGIKILYKNKIKFSFFHKIFIIENFFKKK